MNIEIRGKIEKLLQSSVKLEPRNVSAWNNLAQFYWSNNDPGAARSCLDSALHQYKNKQSLQCLSIVLKNLPTMEKKKIILESIDKATEALKIDIKDGKSWQIQANANISAYFETNDISYLEKAVKGFSMAEKLQSTSICGIHPDLYFNRAYLMEFFENYSLAINDYHAAARLDPDGLKNIVQSRVEEMEGFIKKVCKLLSNSRQKKKQITAAIQSLNTSLSPSLLSSSTSFANRTLSSIKSLIITPSSSPLPLPSSSSINQGKFCIVSILHSINRSSSTPCSFAVVDHDGECAILSLYSVPSSIIDTIKSMDVVHVFEPIIKLIELNNNNNSNNNDTKNNNNANNNNNSNNNNNNNGSTEELKYLCISVLSPQQFLVNGKMLAKESITAPSVSFTLPQTAIQNS